MEYNLKKLLDDAKQQSGKRANLGLENEVMMHMLNDKDFKVGVYKKGEGQVDTLSIYETSRELVASILNNAANISKSESIDLAENFKFNKNESSNMVQISKEFVNQYVTTGKKLAFGSREETNMSLNIKHVESRERTVSVGGIGDKATGKENITIPEHNVVKCSGRNLY